MGIYTREEVVELGPDEYEVSDVETKVKHDVSENANSVPFPGNIQESASDAPKPPKQQAVPEPEKVQAEVVGDDEVPDFMKG